MVEFSANAKMMRSSEIRNLMKLAADPAIISFAGGMPANDLFPTDVIDEIYRGLPTSVKQAAMQYGPTPGYPPLIESLSSYLRGRGLPLENQGLIITAGGQQAINLLTKVLVDPGDLVVTESPAFIGAIAAFRSYGANLSPIPMDNDGMDLDALEKTIESRASQIKMIYITPFFHNPAGIIYSEERRRGLMDILGKRQFCLLEDDPYGELYFDEADKPLTLPIKTMAKESFPVCYVGTFAKILGPGLRLGWLLGPKEIVEKCELAKQSMDACSSTFSQVIAHEYLSRGRLPHYLDWVRPIYRRRAQLMLDALEKNMPSDVTWTKPKGGFYVWLTMPGAIDASEVFKKSIEKGAAFVIGSAFDPHGVKNNSMRLAFSFTPEGQIEKGISIIAEAIRSLL